MFWMVGRFRGGDSMTILRFLDSVLCGKLRWLKSPFFGRPLSEGFSIKALKEIEINGLVKCTSD